MPHALPRRIHLIGVGGDGMSALAGLLHSLGHEISGSEQSNAARTKQSDLLEILARKGVAIFWGHEAGNISPGVQLIIRTSTIPDDNPEIVEARRLEIPIVKRSTALAALMANRRGIAVGGSYGKST